jgi:hypothetical protein
MPSTVEMVLLTGVFAILFVSLVLLVVLGASTLTQFNTLGESLINAYDAVLVTLNQLTDSILQSLQAFADTAVNLFENAATTIGSSFLNVTKFVRTEFASTIQSVGQTTIRLSAQITRSLTGGLVGAASSAVNVFQSLQNLLLQIVQLVAGAIVSAASFIFNTISSMISFLLRLIYGILNCAISPIICAVNCMRPIFGIVFCVVCTFCCVLASIPSFSIPFVFSFPGFSCSLSNLSKASCCGVFGCGGCVGDQFNICENINCPFDAISITSTPCIFGSAFDCPSYCTSNCTQN